MTRKDYQWFFDLVVKVLTPMLLSGIIAIGIGIYQEARKGTDAVQIIQVQAENRDRLILQNQGDIRSLRDTLGLLNNSIVQQTQAMQDVARRLNVLEQSLRPR